MKIVHLISHPSQYAVPLYRLLAKQSDFEFTVIYERGPQRYFDEGFGKHVEWDVDLDTSYRWYDLVTSRLYRILRLAKPDVIWLHGYSTFRHLYAFCLAKLMGCKVWLRGESSLPTDYHPWHSPLRAMFLPHFFEHVDVFLAIGSRNKQFYQAHGVTDERIMDCPYAVDVGWWGSIQCDGVQNDKPIIMFAGKFQNHKRPLDVSAACADYANVIHVGAGPLETEIRASKPPSFTGWANQTQLRYYYSIADVLVVPSSFEPWGIVVNEAMAAGLPIVASDQVRAANDLVIQHVTGMVYPCGNIPALREAIQYVLQHRNTMGEAARRHVQNFSYQADLDGIRKAMEL